MASVRQSMALLGILAPKKGHGKKVGFHYSKCIPTKARAKSPQLYKGQPPGSRTRAKHRLPSQSLWTCLEGINISASSSKYSVTLQKLHPLMQKGNLTSCVFWERIYLNPNFWNIWALSQGCNLLRVQTSWNLYLAGLYVPFHTNLGPQIYCLSLLVKAARISQSTKEASAAAAMNSSLTRSRCWTYSYRRDETRCGVEPWKVLRENNSSTCGWERRSNSGAFHHFFPPPWYL